MVVILTASASILYTVASEDAAITRNTIMHGKAKMAAISGLNHFTALNLQYEDIFDGHEREEAVLKDVLLTRNLYYSVHVILIDSNDKSFLVVSTGIYRRRGKVLSSHTSKALFRQ